MINTIVKMAFTVVNCCPPVYHLYFVVSSQMHAEHFSFVILYKIILQAGLNPFPGLVRPAALMFDTTGLQSHQYLSIGMSVVCVVGARYCVFHVDVVVYYDLTPIDRK